MADRLRYVLQLLQTAALSVPIETGSYSSTAAGTDLPGTLIHMKCSICSRPEIAYCEAPTDKWPKRHTDACILRGGACALAIVMHCFSRPAASQRLLRGRAHTQLQCNGLDDTLHAIARSAPTQVRRHLQRHSSAICLPRRCNNAKCFLNNIMFRIWDLPWAYRITTAQAETSLTVETGL